MPVSLQLLPRELWVGDRVILHPKAPKHMRISVFIFSFLSQQQKLTYWTLLRLESEWAFEKEKAILLCSSVYCDAAGHNIITLLTEDYGLQPAYCTLSTWANAKQALTELKYSL